MRVTNEQIDAIRICHSQLQCSDCKYDKTLDDCDPSKLQLASDLLEARDLIKEMREVIQDSKRFHVNTLENGRDRVVSLGGLCDSVEDMERGDMLVRNANAILEKSKDYA